MPRYVVRRGYHNFEEALGDAHRSFPEAKNLKLIEVPRRRQEYLFEKHYKISFVLPLEKVRGKK